MRDRITKVDTTIRAKYVTFENVDSELTLFGDFKVAECVTVGTKSLNPIAQKLILGSLVRIQKNSITGDEIDPMTFQIYEVEKMTSEDYLFRTTGEIPDSTCTSFPQTVHVHKTDHSECYGIVQLNNGQVAIPYKGIILILQRRR